MKCSYLLIATALATSSVFGGELKVDINRGTKNKTTYTQTGYEYWSADYTDTPASGTGVDTRVFTNSAGNVVTITLSQTEASAATGGLGLRTGLYQAGADAGAKLVSDGVEVDVKDVESPENIVGEIQMTITGLAEGYHTLLTFHNHWDNPSTLTLGPMDIYVGGSLVVDNLQPTIRAESVTSASTAYVEFYVSGPSDTATILFAADPVAGDASITRRTALISGFEIDTPNIYQSATHPYPADEDWHVDADSGLVMLTWAAALDPDMASHNVYFGTDFDAVNTADTDSELFQGNQISTNHPVFIDDLHATYYWRIDEVSVSNEVSTGTVWSFRPRYLAFPGAEGYGRFARGGRGGKVVHVTSLEDYTSGESPIPGTLRYAISEETGARVIVFDISGLITLKERLTLSDDFVTVAGQTAPGKGICLKKWPMGMSGANDVIIRFMRSRPGRTLQTITVDKYSNGTSGTPVQATAAVSVDGMGMQGSSHSIIDHCSISWTIDESFSSRSASSITLQRTLISEALNKALHPNYIFLDNLAGTEHGYAASVGGDVGSFHHNLLAHCYGRNWSMAGGLDAEANFAGRLDFQNNVVYNWGGRTTDGGAMEVDFEGNYYKPGAGTTLVPYALTMNHEDNFGGSQRCYFNGNVMPGYFGESTQSVGRRSVVSSGITVDYETFVDAPFFPSYVTTQTALGAYKSVLSDTGCNRPLLDDHDARIVQETLNGSYTYSGSVTGKHGFPDVESDVGGWEDYPVVTRDDGWDSDGDGLPDWFETSFGLDPDSAENDFSDANMPLESTGYTYLDYYLAWMAFPRVETVPGTAVDLDLTLLTAGYTDQPEYTVSGAHHGTVELLGDGHTARFTPDADFSGPAQFAFSVTDGAGDSMSGQAGVLVSTEESDSRLQIEYASGVVRYQLYGTSGTSYAMEYSTNLISWQEFTNLTATGSWQTNALPSGVTARPQLFLRAVR